MTSRRGLRWVAGLLGIAVVFGRLSFVDAATQVQAVPSGLSRFDVGSEDPEKECLAELAHLLNTILNTHSIQYTPGSRKPWTIRPVTQVDPSVFDPQLPGRLVKIEECLGQPHAIKPNATNVTPEVLGLGIQRLLNTSPNVYASPDATDVGVGCLFSTKQDAANAGQNACSRLGDAILAQNREEAAPEYVEGPAENLIVSEAQAKGYLPTERPPLDFSTQASPKRIETQPEGSAASQREVVGKVVHVHERPPALSTAERAALSTFILLGVAQIAVAFLMIRAIGNLVVTTRSLTKLQDQMRSPAAATDGPLAQTLLPVIQEVRTTLRLIEGMVARTSPPIGDQTSGRTPEASEIIELVDIVEMGASVKNLDSPESQTPTSGDKFPAGVTDKPVTPTHIVGPSTKPWEPLPLFRPPVSLHPDPRVDAIVDTFNLKFNDATEPPRDWVESLVREHRGIWAEFAAPGSRDLRHTDSPPKPGRKDGFICFPASQNHWIVLPGPNFIDNKAAFANSAAADNVFGGVFGIARGGTHICVQRPARGHIAAGSTAQITIDHPGEILIPTS